MDRQTLLVALLRFASQSTIDEHAAPHAVDVICLEGAGLFSVDGEAAPLQAGECVQWPPTRPHRLWTEESSMMTLMIEHPT
jgi:quercetin dioxygenase-like cupin family protein